MAEDRRARAGRCRGHRADGRPRRSRTGHPGDVNDGREERIRAAAAAGDLHRRGAAPAAPPPPAAVPAPETPAGPERIGIEDFAKVDLRVAKVVAAERVEGSKKLVRMQVDVGIEQRTIVAGIAEAYEPETLVGRSIVVVSNLKPAKLMGIESNGMVLAGEPGRRAAGARWASRTLRRPAAASSSGGGVDRQPLPPRRRGVRRDLGEVVGARAAAGRDRRPVHPRRGRRGRGRPGRALRGRLARAAVQRRACTRTRRTSSRAAKATWRGPSLPRASAVPRRLRDRGDRPRLPLRLLARGTSSARCSGAGGACAAPALPVVIHTREADEDTLAILSRRGRGRGRGGCSTASPAAPWLARAGARPRLRVSFAGIVTFPRAEALRAIAADVPARPAARRDRQPVPCARAPSGQAERAGVGRSHGGDDCAGARHGGGRIARRCRRELRPTVSPAAGLGPGLRAGGGALTLRAQVWSDHRADHRGKTRLPRWPTSSSPSVPTSSGSSTSSSARSSRASG